VGEGAIRELLERRNSGPFESLADLCARVDCRQINRRVLEALVKAGAFDGLAGHRAQKLAGIDAAMDYGQTLAQERDLGQTSLFGGPGAPLPPPALPEAADLATSVRLAQEKETIGLYISGHPLADKAAELARRTTTSIAGLRELPEDQLVSAGGVVTSSRRVVTKAGGQMLIARLEDMTGAIEAVVFPKWYPQLSPLFVEDAIVIVKARVKERRQGPQSRLAPVPADAGDSMEEERPEISLQVVEAWPLASAPTLSARLAPPISAAPIMPADLGRTNPATLNVRLCGDSQDARRLGRLRDLVTSASGGPGKIVLHAGNTGDTRPLKQLVIITAAMRDELTALFGGDNVWEADER